VATHSLAGAALLLCAADAAEVTGWVAYRLPLLDESGFLPDYLVGSPPPTVPEALLSARADVA
jgi:hypothetical protein